MDCGDTGVIQAGQDLRFSLEPGKPIRIGRKGLRQDLERDLPIELCVGGPIDLTHPALAD